MRQRYDIIALTHHHQEETPMATRRAPQPGTPRPSTKRKRLDSREDTVITSMALPRGVHRQARMAALDLNWTLAEVVREALAEWLARHETEMSTGPGGRR
jgi:hypothetical protein